MTQSPDNAGAGSAGHQAAGRQDGDRPPAAVPPPGVWHFPAEPVPPAPPPAPAPAPQPYGWQASYGTSPHYGTPPAPGGLPRYGTQAPYGTPGPYGEPYGGLYPGGTPGQDARLAEWWRRLLARVIDVLAVGVVLVPISIPLLSRPFSRFEQLTAQYPDLNAPGAQAALTRADGKLVIALWTFGLIAAAIWFGYDAVQHARWGQTLGKRALSTRVVSAHDGSPVGAAAAVRRAAVYALVPAIPVAGTVFAIVNQLWLLWDRRRQCLHDKAARTIVVRTGGPPGGGAGQVPPW